MREHQLTIRDYLRHSNLNVTNQYLQATSNTKRLAQGKLVDAILPTGLLSASKSTLIQKKPARLSPRHSVPSGAKSVLLDMKRLMDPNGPRFSGWVFVCG